MAIKLGSITIADVETPSPSASPIPGRFRVLTAWMTNTTEGKGRAEEEEYYSSWSLFLVCLLLILSLWTSYYLQIKRIRAVNETIVSIFAGMFVGLIVRLAPGTMIREMLVS
jgi:sodium/hydrogen exchanger-like protein 6/7